MFEAGSSMSPKRALSTSASIRHYRVFSYDHANHFRFALKLELIMVVESRGMSIASSCAVQYQILHTVPLSYYSMIARCEPPCRAYRGLAGIALHDHDNESNDDDCPAAVDMELNFYPNSIEFISSIMYEVLSLFPCWNFPSQNRK